MAKEYTEKKITINLSNVFNKPVTKRAKSGVFLVRSKVTKETRAKEVFLSNKVNETLWEKGMLSCPRKISVKIVNDKGKARVYLPDEKVELKKEETKKEKGLKAKVEEMTKKETEEKAPTEEANVEKKEETEPKENKKEAAASTKETKK